MKHSCLFLKEKKPSKSQKNWLVLPSPWANLLLTFLDLNLHLSRNPKDLCISWVQSLSRVPLSATSWTAARQPSPSYHQVPELTQTHVHWVGDAIQPSHPLSSPSPPAFSLSHTRSLDWNLWKHSYWLWWCLSAAIEHHSPGS